MYKSGQDVFLDFPPSILSLYHTTSPHGESSDNHDAYVNIHTLCMFAKHLFTLQNPPQMSLFEKPFMMPSSTGHGIILCNPMRKSNPFSINRAFFPHPLHHDHHLNCLYAILKFNTMFGTY